MKKKLLIAILAVVAIIGVFTIFGDKSSKANKSDNEDEILGYDYSADQYIIDHLDEFPEIKDNLKTAKEACANKDSTLGCLVAKKLEALMSKDIKK